MNQHTTQTNKAAKALLMAAAMMMAPVAAAHAQGGMLFFEGFEQALDGWTTVDADGDANCWMAYDFSELPPYFAQLGYVAYEGNSVAVSIATGSDQQGNPLSLNPDNWLIGPEIEIDEDASAMLGWWIKDFGMGNAADYYEVRLSTGGTDTADFDTVLFSETLSATNYVQRVASLAAWAGQTVRIAFRHRNSAGGASLALDAVSVVDQSRPIVGLHAPQWAFAGDSVCLGVSISSATEVTDITWIIDTDTNGATIEEGGTDSVFCFAWDADAAEGQYTVRVVVSNSEGSSADSATVTLRRCDVVEQMPYAHTFGSDEDCWQTEGWNTGTYSLPWQGVEVGSAVSFSTDFMGTDLHTDARLTTPRLLLPDEGPMELKYIVAEGAEGGDRYAVIVHADGAADTLADERLAYGDIVLRKVGLMDYAGQVIQVEFRHFDSPTGYALMVAGVEVRPLTAPEVTLEPMAPVRMGEPVELRATVVSAEEPDYSWTTSGGTPQTSTDSVPTVTWAATGTYTVEVEVSNSAGQAQAQVQLTVVDCTSELEAPTSEGFEGGLGCWTGIDADGDGECWTDVASTLTAAEQHLASLLMHGANSMISFSTRPDYGIEYLMRYGMGTPMATDNWLVSPAIALPEGQQWWLSWSAASLGEASYELDSYEVLLSEGGAEVSDFSTTLRPLGTAPGDTYHTYSADLSAWAGQTVRIAFRHHTTGRKAVLIDDVAVGTANPVGIQGATEAGLTLRPTLATNHVEVQAQGLRQVEVIDLGGRTLYGARTDGDTHSIDIEHLPAGTYIVRATTASGIAMQRFVRL